MKNNWKETTLKEILKIRNGKSRPENGSKYPVYGGNGILGYADEYNVDAETIIIGRVGAYCGSVFLENNKFWLSDNALGINSNQYSDIKYLYYLLKNLNLNRNAIGGAQPLLTQGVLYQIEIRLPKSIDEQKAIAKILSSLDDKIELLREQNKTLEATAQTIFKEWFVNFNFPDENGKPYKDAGGKMIDSELGKIPDRWRVGKLGDLLDLQGGFVHNTKISGNSISKIAKMGVVDGKNWFNRNSVIDYYEKIDGKYRLQEDDLVVCTRDVTQDRVIIGNVAMVPADLAKIGLYAGSNTWIVKSDLNKYFLFLLFREKNFRQHIIQSSKGTTIIMITRDAFLNCDVIIPANDFIDSLMENVGPIFEKIKNNSEQIQTLLKTRDTLLPKLMSGEIEFKD